MGGAGVQFSLFRGGASAANGVPGRAIQELWFALAQRPWSSLVLVPADEGISTASFATELADVGGRLRDSPVTAILADSMDFESARMLADLQLRVHVEHPRRKDAKDAVEVEARIVRVGPEASAGERPTPAAREAQPMPPTGRIVVAIQPVVVEPLGVAIAQAASAVLLCVELGRTRIDAVRRTIDLIGPERIVGAFLVR